MAKSNLPIEVHDHFRKANILHGYFVKSLGDSKEHALGVGQELLAAKESIPHGSWEPECGRLFDGSLRNAQFYMQFAKHMLALPKTQMTALLLTESTLEGAAKSAKKAAGADKPKPRKQKPSTQPSEPVKPDFGKCPACAGTKWKEDDGVWCVKCNHPHGEPVGDVDDKHLSLQRSKTIKTAEALMRAFDDLQMMKANGHHDAAIDGCKSLLRMARAWK